MNTLLKILAAFCALVIASAAVLLSAQSDVIPACTDEELDRINERLEENIQQLKFLLISEDDQLPEAIDDMTILQRSHWTSVIAFDIASCTETYTRYYELGRIIDEYSIALGVQAGAGVALVLDDEDQYERLLDQSTKHIREAKRNMERIFPELYIELYGENG